MQKGNALWMLALVSVLALYGCRAEEEPQPQRAVPVTQPAPELTPSKGTAENPWVVGMSQCNLGEPWRVQMNEDVRAAAEKQPGLEVVFKDASNDTQKQRAHVDEFLAQGVDLLIVSPKEAAPLTPPVRRVYEKGIPVVVLDRKILGDTYTCFIGADNVKIGYEAGKHIAETLLKGKGNVVELKGLMTSTPGQERNEGFRNAIKAHPDIKVIFEADCKWLEPNGRKEMESALARFDDIDVVYAHNDPQAHGAWIAAKAAGRENDIRFVGIDALTHEGVQYVQKGVLDATLQYPTGGVEAIDIALKILAGETVPKNITLGTRIFTTENVDQGGQSID